MFLPLLKDRQKGIAANEGTGGEWSAQLEWCFGFTSEAGRPFFLQADGEGEGEGEAYPTYLY